MHKKQNIKHQTTPTKSKKPTFFDPKYTSNTHCVSIKDPKQKPFQKEDVFSKNVVQLKSAFEAENTSKMKLEVQPIYKPDVEKSEIAIDEAKGSTKQQVTQGIVPQLKEKPIPKAVFYGKHRNKTAIWHIWWVLFGRLFQLEEERNNENHDNNKRLSLWQRIVRFVRRTLNRKR